MKKFIQIATLFLLSIIFSAFYSINTYADAPSSIALAHEKSPVLIIRFNQPNVRYKQPLKLVIERAQEIKPDVNVTLVSIVPVFDQETKNKASREIAEYNAGKVAAAVKALNIPADHVRIEYQESTDIAMNEVHVVVYGN